MTSKFAGNEIKAVYLPYSDNIIYSLMKNERV